MTARGSVDTSTPHFVGRLELLGAHTSQVAVATGSIVERRDVASNVGQRELSVPVDLPIDPFLLQAAEEGLGHRVVPAVVFPAHPRLEVV